MDENHFFGNPPTGTVLIGYQRGEWPLRIFAKAVHAATWLEDAKPGEIRLLWEYHLDNPIPVELVPSVRTDATLKRRDA